MPRRANPTRLECLAGLAEIHDRLSSMIGRWADHIPADVKTELAAIRDVPEGLLIRAGRLGNALVTDATKEAV